MLMGDIDVKQNLENAYRSLENAIKLEESGRNREAIKEYLNAAEYLLDASKNATGEIKKARVEKAEEIIKRVDILKNKVQGSEIRANSSDGKDEDPKSFEELGIPYVVKPNVTFADVAGLDQVKEQIRLKIIYPLQHPDKARKYGVRSGGGVLLYGPPGTGKTHIARAIANEVNATFVVINPSTLLSQWFGVFEKKISQLFKLARNNGTTVIFFDEIEAIIPKRSRTDSSVMKRAVPQLLAEMDGFAQEGKSGLLVMGATNAPWDIDEAILRPGRFDEKIYVPPPDLSAREKIFMIGMSKLNYSHDIDFSYLASITEGYSGADISYIIRKVGEKVFMESVEKGIDREINRSDLEETISDIRPSIDPKMLEKFQKYSQIPIQ